MSLAETILTGIAIAQSIGTGLGLGMTALALAAAFVGWLMVRERSAGAAVAKLDATAVTAVAAADATQRTAAQVADDSKAVAVLTEKVTALAANAAAHDARDTAGFNEIRDSLREMRTAMDKRFDTQDEALDKVISDLASQRTTVATVLAREDAQDARIADIARRQSGQLAAVKP